MKVKKSFFNWFAKSTVCLVMLCAVPFFALAAEYPDKPIKMIVGFTPGGVTDAGARVFAEILGNRLGQSVIVENKAGVGGVLGTTYVSRAEPDGYTLLYATSGPMVVADSLRTVTYDTLTDFTGITGLSKLPMVLVVNAKSNFQTLEDMMDYAKANPGKLTYASAGLGTAPQLAAEALKDQAGIDILHVPYKGLAEARMDLLAGRVDMIFEYKVTIDAYVESGELVPLVAASSSRSSGFPTVPTLAESGFPGVSAVPWTALFIPAGATPQVIERLSQAAEAASKDPEMLAFLEENGQEYFKLGHKDFVAFLKDDKARWAKLVELASGNSNQ